MNILANQTENNDAQCCVDFCKTTFSVSRQEIVNNYKCDQQPFSTSDLWKISRNKKEVSVRTAIY